MMHLCGGGLRLRQRCAMLIFLSRACLGRPTTSWEQGTVRIGLRRSKKMITMLPLRKCGSCGSFQELNQTTSLNGRRDHIWATGQQNQHRIIRQLTSWKRRGDYSLDVMT